MVIRSFLHWSDCHADVEGPTSARHQINHSLCVANRMEAGFKVSSIGKSELRSLIDTGAQVTFPTFVDTRRYFSNVLVQYIMASCQFIPNRRGFSEYHLGILSDIFRNIVILKEDVPMPIEDIL